MYFLLNVSHYVKSFGHFVKFWPFYYPHSPNMVMSRDPEANFLFCTNSTSNIRNGHKSSGGKAFYFGSYQPESSRGVKNTPSPSVPLGLNNHCTMCLA